MKLSNSEMYDNYQGVVEFIIKDRNGRVIDVRQEHNLVKIFAKEMLAHALPYKKYWDPDGGSGSGAWVTISSSALPEALYDVFAPKYILLGASFSDTGAPLGKSDTRYYSFDVITNTYTPITPGVGADNDGGLINPVPISDPYRPLKRVENITFESSYQPTDTPLLDDTVRAMNNVVQFETTLRTDEYNGFESTGSTYFTITEVALAGGKEIGPDIGSGAGSCECAPRILLLEGVGGDHDASLDAVAAAGSTITLDPGLEAEDVNRIVPGDQILIVDRSGSFEEYSTLNQQNPFYLCLAKSDGGHDIVLDRTPTYLDGSGNEQMLTGEIGVYKDTLRLFSQRVLSEPITKSDVFEITIRWSIFFS